MKKRVVYVFLALMICFIFVYIYNGLSNVQKMKVTIISSGELIEKIENRDNFTAYFSKQDVLDVIKLLQSLMNILKIPIFQFMLLIWKQLNIQLIY